MKTFEEKLNLLAKADIEMLIEKGRTYGDSWKKRGGVGAAMMLARKWDRIEKALEQNGYNIFDAIHNVDYLTDDIQDLGCYLWLVRSEGMVIDDDGEPLPHGYVDQDQENDWSEIAVRSVTDPHLKEMLSIGDSEIKDYYAIRYQPQTTKKELENFFKALKAYYFSTRAGLKQPSLLSFMAGWSNVVYSFTDPIKEELYRFPRFERSSCDDDCGEEGPQRYDKDQP